MLVAIKIILRHHPVLQRVRFHILYPMPPPHPPKFYYERVYGSMMATALSRGAVRNEEDSRPALVEESN